MITLEQVKAEFKRVYGESLVDEDPIEVRHKRSGKSYAVYWGSTHYLSESDDGKACLIGWRTFKHPRGGRCWRYLNPQSIEIVTSMAIREAKGES